MNCNHDIKFHQVLNELTYKDIKHAIDPRDLPHRDYAPLIPFVRYVETKQDTMKFFVPNKYNGWNVYIKFVQWHEQVNDKTITATEAARLLLWSGDIQTMCGCPSYVFYGYKFIQTKLDMAIIPEIRFPKIRNPSLLGICCKHQRRVFLTLGWHLGDIAAAIKSQRNSI